MTELINPLKSLFEEWAAQGLLYLSEDEELEVPGLCRRKVELDIYGPAIRMICPHRDNHGYANTSRVWLKSPVFATLKARELIINMCGGCKERPSWLEVKKHE